MLRGRAGYFELVKVLGLTDFKLRFSTSILGYLWSVLKPLGIFFVLYMVFGRMLRFSADPLYRDKLLLGIFIWGYFSEASTAGIQSLLGKSHIISKVYFPRSIAVLGASINYLLTFGINLCIVAVFFAVDGVGLNRYSPLFLLYVAELYLIVLGIVNVLETPLTSIMPPQIYSAARGEERRKTRKPPPSSTRLTARMTALPARKTPVPPLSSAIRPSIRTRFEYSTMNVIGLR